jgi:hypothetical protein
VGLWLERRPRPRTIVLQHGGCPTSRWPDWTLALCVPAGLVLLALLGAYLFLASEISPVRVTVGEPFALGGVTYRVSRQHIAHHRLFLTLEAWSSAPFPSCPGIAAFQLDQGGRLTTARGDGCFPLPPDHRPETIVPVRVLGTVAWFERLIREANQIPATAVPRSAEPEMFANDVAEQLAEEAAALPQLDHVRDAWWRPGVAQSWYRWTISFPVSAGGPRSLVVRAVGGFHEFGFDRYAIITLA